MKFDGALNIASGMCANSRTWKNKKILWSELVKKLTKDHRTNELFSQYQAASREERGKIKDVGGFVGGYLRGGRRKQQNVLNRQLLTLDLDYAPLDFWEDFTLQFGNSAVLHSTHSHTEDKPRFRLVIPLNREVTPDEYVAISRRIAGFLGIEYFDNTTFEVHRLMFWPSTSKDKKLYSEFQDGVWLDADEILDSYVDWSDSTAWPTSKKVEENLRIQTGKQQDPELKRGVVGAFCRSYTISEAIETYLSDIYKRGTEGRYTYVNGSTSNGLVVYDEKFAFSHHGTDPCSGKLCNVFDLIRIHKFGHLDPDNSKAKSKSKSFTAMEDLSKTDKEVRATIARERIKETNYEFRKEFIEEEESINLKWAEDLEVDSRGKYLSNANNLNLIFKNDPVFKGAFKFNKFDNKRYLFKSSPWRDIEQPEPIRNVDYSGIRNYLDGVYQIIGKDKIEDALALQFENHSFHPIKDYLNSLSWDGKPRLENVLIDYYGVEDSLYTREAIRKPFVAATARVFEPGKKFDLVLVLVGDQGTGKSTLVDKFGKSWSSDTFMTVKGKEAFEQLQGSWLIEIPELAALRKSDAEATKHYITKREDKFRPAFGKTVELYKRQCVFFGNVNDRNFLNDPTGNRRFIPVDVRKEHVTKDIHTIQDIEIDQIWAEAFALYKKGEKLYMSEAAHEAAKEHQKEHSAVDERKGIIQNYLDHLLPESWDELGLIGRREYLSGEISTKGTKKRQFVCIAEIWCECLELEKKNMDRYKTRQLNDIMRHMDGWRFVNSTKNFRLYGKQKYYVKL